MNYFRCKFISCRGLTVIELLVTLSIFAILATLAMPSYNWLVNDGRQSSQLSKFERTLMLVRSEAVKRGGRAMVCTSNTGVACDGSLDWNEGWIAFVDTNFNSDRDTGEELIRTNPYMEGGLTLIGSSAVTNQIRYLANGLAMESGTLTLCDSRGDDKAKAILISASGKAKTSTTASGGASLSCP